MIVRHFVRDAGGRPYIWAWMVPVLLLICALTIPRLDLEAFYIDEGASLFNVGALHTGPLPIARMLEETAEHSPEQAQGWPLLLYAWGRLVGWSEDAQAPVHYSIALHLIDVATLERSAQLDLGIGAGNIVPLHAEFDLGELAAGEYTLRLTLYNWETDVRLSARDLTLGHVSDIHTLQHVFLE